MRVARLGLAAALVLGAVLLISSTASAEGVFYYKGPHAVPSEFGGFCKISVRHFHTYKPNDMKVFRHDENTYIFIGDPTAHGFVGPKVAYYGHHPIPSGWGGRWCFISGPHFHFYRVAGAHWAWHGGSYYYTGPYTDPWYIRNRAVYEPVFTKYYTTRPGYVRPVVYAAPPKVYLGPRITVPVTRWSGPTVRVKVGMPAVRVGAPGIRVGGPAVRVGGPAVRVGGPAVRVGGPVVPGVRPGVVGPGVRPGVMAPGVRPGVVAPGVRPGVVAPGVRPGVRPMPGSKMMPPGRPMPPGKAMPVRPMPAARGPVGRPMPPAKAAPMPRPGPAARGPAPRPMPAAKAAPRPAPRPAPARPAPRPAGKRP